MLGESSSNLICASSIILFNSAISSSFKFKKQYKPYGNRTTNEDAVKASVKYQLYEQFTADATFLLQKGMGKASSKPTFEPSLSMAQGNNIELRSSYAKFAICCFVARSDNKLSPTEKSNLDAMFLDIYHSHNDRPDVKKELLTIYNMPNINLMFIEK